MPPASSLEELLRVRHENRADLERFNSIWGTALGKKNGTGDPAILVFVPRKIDAKWLPSQEVVPETLQGPGGLTCPTDVIQVEGYEPRGPSDEVRTANLSLRDELWGASDRMRPGSQLAYWDRDGSGWHGTLGCFTRDRMSGRLGILTNYHVGDYIGNVIKHPEQTSRAIGIVRKGEVDIGDEVRFPGIIDEDDAFYRIDAAFIELLPDLEATTDFDTELSYLTRNGTRQRKPLGQPLDLDLSSMDVIGMKVIGVGRTRGCQRGEVFAFAYEWKDEEQNNNYTDYLIANEIGQQFSAGGDSGKLVVTDDDYLRPLALLWGGNQGLRARHGQQEEDWTFAVDINVILDRLDLDIES